MKILLIEDEPKTGKFLKKGLTEAGFVADVAAEWRDGLHLMLMKNYDLIILIILDVMLPSINGWKILRKMQRSDRQFPVLFLTAGDQVNNSIKGLKLGVVAPERRAIETTGYLGRSPGSDLTV